MAPIVIYGRAVQEARDRIRSAHISAMFDVLGVGLFTPEGSASSFANAFSRWVNGLQPIPLAENDAFQNAAAQRANTQLAAAKARNGDFVQEGNVLDVFAIGDILRYLGEFFEFGGGADETATTLNQFRKALRNQLAFNRANRARQPVSDYDLTLHPDLGIYRLELLNRSTVKYMERFYGPYLGADVSGTTTDALDVLAYYCAYLSGEKVDEDDLEYQADIAIGTGREMIPIASMVLQYHHSLMECGLALALPSRAMGGEDRPAPAIQSYNFYDFQTLVGSAAIDPVKKVMTRANAILSQNLAGRGLIILRDVIDIQGSPYADVEIGALMDAPQDSGVFNIPDQYGAFSGKRREQMLQDNVFYNHDNPSLAAMVGELFEGAGFAGKDLENIISMNSLDLSAWASEDEGRGNVFASLDTALAAARAQNEDVQEHAIPPHNDLRVAVSGGTPQSDAASPLPGANPHGKTGRSSSVGHQKLRDLEAIAQALTAIKHLI